MIFHLGATLIKENAIWSISFQGLFTSCRFSVNLCYAKFNHAESSIDLLHFWLFHVRVTFLKDFNLYQGFKIIADNMNLSFSKKK